MKFSVELFGSKEWVNKAMMNLAIGPLKTLANVMSAIKGRAQSQYLTGPYPEHLRVGRGGTGGHLRQQLIILMSYKDPEIIGKLTVASTAYYGLIWEAVGRYKHRVGKIFSGNDTPMHRPFALPAYKDLASWTIQELRNAIVEAVE